MNINAEFEFIQSFFLLVFVFKLFWCLNRYFGYKSYISIFDKIRVTDVTIF